MDGWASPTAPTETGTGDVLKKEAAIRDVIQLQQSLTQLLAQIDSTTAQNAKLEAEGDLLQMYIENLWFVCVDALW
ncbi:hypothetical protein QFC20_003822 [Naganishia adeliensis]|uniref:Uncharacterized protein n=1 Tax=Naganishia adeliensis TaxID=92952 RepID=A0ACC2W7M1_9TREE|nr:hypothetical protein QFC20_003822 [Naganishia adeliensis]